MNFPEAQDQKVIVIDVLVDVSPIAIDSFHETPQYKSDFCDNLNEI